MFLSYSKMCNEAWLWRICSCDCLKKRHSWNLTELAQTSIEIVSTPTILIAEWEDSFIRKWIAQHSLLAVNRCKVFELWRSRIIIN